MIVILITILSSENRSPFCQFLDGCYCYTFKLGISSRYHSDFQSLWHSFRTLALYGRIEIKNFGNKRSCAWVPSLTFKIYTLYFMIEKQTNEKNPNNCKSGYHLNNFRYLKGLDKSQLGKYAIEVIVDGFEFPYYGPKHKKHRKKSHLIIHCPTSEGVSEVSERGSERSGARKRSEQGGASKWQSRASEWDYSGPECPGQTSSASQAGQRRFRRMFRWRK